MVVLGPTGRNFAAGMSGGVAYVYDAAGTFAAHCNQAMVDLEPVAATEEAGRLRALIERHSRLTGSNRADALLADWSRSLGRFVKVYPRDFKRMQEALGRAVAAGHTGEEALHAAFYENASDLARVGGN